MNQRNTLVARAIVQHEIRCLPDGGGAVSSCGPAPHLTVESIVVAYDLQWGEYSTGQWVADQLVRNALNEAARHDQLLRKGKDGRYVVYTIGDQ